MEVALLSAAAGTLLAASSFSLLLPGVEHGGAQFASKPLGVAMVIAGILFGACLLYVIHVHVPHEHSL